MQDKIRAHNLIRLFVAQSLPLFIAQSGLIDIVNTLFKSLALQHLLHYQFAPITLRLGLVKQCLHQSICSIADVFGLFYQILDTRFETRGGIAMLSLCFLHLFFQLGYSLLERINDGGHLSAVGLFQLLAAYV